MDVNAMYKCEKCGAVMEVIFAGKADPECCGDGMKVVTENTVDAAKEKHVPVIERVDGGYKVKVGSVAHPMTAEHWITTVELLTDKQLLRQTLNPGEQPEAFFRTDDKAVKAREYCNLHGLWVAQG